MWGSESVHLLGTCLGTILPPGVGEKFGKTTHQKVDGGSRQEQEVMKRLLPLSE